MNATSVVAAIDIGGTKIRAGLVAADGAVLHAETSPSLALEGAEQVLAQMHSAMQSLQLIAVNKAITVRAIGISSAGVIDTAQGLVMSATDAIPRWAGTKLAAVFSEGYALDCVVENDARCALLGEAWLGTTVERVSQAPVVMLTLGTGLGSAMMVDNQVLAGAHLLAGHLGRTIIWDSATNKYCPLEYLVSGSGLLNIYRHLPDATNFPIADGQALIAAILHGTGNAKVLAVTALNLWVNHLARAIVNLVWLLDPSRIIIGGGVVAAQHLWWEQLVLAVKSADLPTPHLRLSPAVLGNDAGMIGAAKLAWQRLEETSKGTSKL